MRKNILKILPVLLAVLLLGTGTALWVSRGFTVSESESGTAQGEEDKTGKQTGAEAESQGGIETSGGAAESENENADMQSEDISQAEQGESVLAFHVTVLGDSIAKGYSGDKAVDIESYGSIAADKLSGELGMPYSFQNFAKNGLDSAGMNEKILPREDVQESIASADVIFITLGSNDLLNECKRVVQEILNTDTKFKSADEALEVLEAVDGHCFQERLDPLDLHGVIAYTGRTQRYKTRHQEKGACNSCTQLPGTMFPC